MENSKKACLYKGLIECMFINCTSVFIGQNCVCKYTRAMKNENLSGQQYMHVFSSEQNKLDKMKNKTITTKRTIERNSDNITINLFSNTA